MVGEKGMGLSMRSTAAALVGCAGTVLPNPIIHGNWYDDEAAALTPAGAGTGLQLQGY